MEKVNLQKLIDKAREMALCNVWSEKAYKLNMAILKRDKNNCAACTRLAKYYKLNNNIEEAKNMYLRTLDIDPEHRGAINNLDAMRKDREETEKVEQITTIKELLKEGQRSMLKGKYKLAVKLFVKAYSTEPLLKHAVSLASAYKQLGKFDRIEELYKQLIESTRKKAEIEAINIEFKMLGLKVS